MDIPARLDRVRHDAIRILDLAYEYGHRDQTLGSTNTLLVTHGKCSCSSSLNLPIYNLRRQYRDGIIRNLDVYLPLLVEIYGIVPAEIPVVRQLHVRLV